MEDRKRRVLQAIVDDYIHTAEPVGSRTVARKYGLGVSPATIRNEMADLEEMGYLEQPHTSAGRVPSDKGYRFYVDTLVAAPGPGEVDTEAVRRALAARAQRIDAVVRQGARLLAEMTDFLALASQPAGREAAVSALQVVPLRGTLAVLLVVADDGRVLSRMVEFAAPPDAAALDELGHALSQRLLGVPLRVAGERLPAAVAEVVGSRRLYQELVDEASALLGEPEDGGSRLVVDGAPNLLKQPEFREVSRAKQVLGALEREEQLEERLTAVDASGAGVEVVIGREIQIEDMAECSLVTAVYGAPGGVLGRIGVLGPRRMEYGRMMAMVETVADAVTAVLHGHGTLARLFAGVDPAGGWSVRRTDRAAAGAAVDPASTSSTAGGCASRPRAG